MSKEWQDVAEGWENAAKYYLEVLAMVAKHIDWDQQDCSRFFIGEDAAERVLMALKFDWDLGMCNESVDHFIKHIYTGPKPE